jgi:hypothetical protein
VRLQPYACALQKVFLRDESHGGWGIQNRAQDELVEFWRDGGWVGSGLRDDTGRFIKLRQVWGGERGREGRGLGLLGTVLLGDGLDATLLLGLELVVEEEESLLVVPVWTCQWQEEEIEGGTYSGSPEITNMRSPVSS